MMLLPYNPTEFFREMIFMTDFYNESDQPPYMCEEAQVVNEQDQQREELFDQPEDNQDQVMADQKLTDGETAKDAVMGEEGFAFDEDDLAECE